jgi:hypothetical protein
MNQSCGLRYYFSGVLLRALWADLCQCGWHHASEEKITHIRCRIENCVQSSRRPGLIMIRVMVSPGVRG